MSEGFSLSKKGDYLQDQTRYTQAEGYLSSPFESLAGEKELLVEVGKKLSDFMNMGEVREGIIKKGSESILVVIKFLNIDPNFSGKYFRDRFDREVELTASLPPNPYLIRYYGICNNDKLGKGLVIEFVDGQSMRDFLEKSRIKTFDTTSVVKIGVEIALGASTLHQAGVIHRDITPGNIMLEPDSESDDSLFPYRAKLIDFGIVKYLRQPQEETLSGDHLQETKGWDDRITPAGSAAATPRYAAPEQLNDDYDEIRENSDLYAIGCILYELVGGKHVFSDYSGISGQVGAHKNVMPHPLVFPYEKHKQLNLDMGALIHTLLEKDPKDRRYFLLQSEEAKRAGVFGLPIGSCLHLAEALKRLLEIHGHSEILKKPPFSFVNLEVVKDN